MTNPWHGAWTYRSFYNDPNLSTPLNNLELGAGTLRIDALDDPTLLTGTIGTPGEWGLDLHGSLTLGTPAQARFQGKGLNNGEQWIYDYIAWLVPVWPSSTAELQKTAMVGSVTRTIPHASSSGGISPAGVVGSFFAVKLP